MIGVNVDDAYKDDKKLCEWLRANSSGAYRLSGYAADRIETLSLHLSSVQGVCDANDAAIKELVGALVALSVASCTCLTKTPDFQFHEKECRYRLICEIIAKYKGWGVVI